ncbi:alkaline phosphatase family protein [Tunturiibacter gelidoferens]|uniref:Alkaline phosphatase family protein n=1 Tax=Tunturiibacter gelidiferens TaxID=3069689 RepID=A0AAU7YZ52_9BACT
MQWNRRDFTKHAFLAGGSAVLGCSTRVQSIAPIASPTYPTLPPPASSGLEHLVVVTMENRSFDHFLGWLPNAAGIQAGLNFTDKSGASRLIHSLSGDFTGCPQSDPITPTTGRASPTTAA